MKFAMCNEMFECWNTTNGFDFDRCFEFLAQCGYDGVEIAPFTLSDNIYDVSATRRVQILQSAEKAGLEITGLHWLLAKTNGYYLTSPDPVIRQKTTDYFLTLIRLCADFNGHFMVLGSPMQRNLLPGVSLEQGMEYAQDVLQPLVPLLEKTGVQIAIEPLTTAETDFLTTAESAQVLIDRIGARAQIALHLDCKAMCGETIPIPELIRTYRDSLIYFHLNDPNRQGPGFGDLAFGPIIQALHEVGYSGWASVEPFDYSPGVERLSQESLAHVKQFVK